MWNHRIHQRWAGEDLTFWRMAFFPQYDQDKVLEILQEQMVVNGVRSYAVYETLGIFDLFVRAWVPSQTFERFEEALKEALAPVYLQLLESFFVSRTLRHHLWPGEELRPEEPEQSFLEDKWPSGTILAANEATLAEDLALQAANTCVLRPLIQRSGIKFFTIITQPGYSVIGPAKRRLESELYKAFDEFNIEQPALYEGSGFGQFVLMGRVDAENYFDITSLAEFINGLGIREFAGARPYTYLCAGEDVLYYADRLPTDIATDELDVDALLAQDENQTLEFKGSALSNLDRWLATDDAEPVADDSMLDDGIIRAIVGMLNADGGTLVIGALEAKRKYGGRAADEHPKLAGAPQRGNYVIVGIDAEPEFTEKEQKGLTAWDAFRLWLLDVIGTRIDPAPAGAIGISPHEISGRTLCIVRIQPSRATWYYRLLKARQTVSFFVREDGRTMSLIGSAADVYKRTNPRG